MFRWLRYVRNFWQKKPVINEKRSEIFLKSVANKMFGFFLFEKSLYIKCDSRADVHSFLSFESVFACQTAAFESKSKKMCGIKDVKRHPCFWPFSFLQRKSFGYHGLYFGRKRFQEETFLLCVFSNRLLCSITNTKYTDFVSLLATLAVF